MSACIQPFMRICALALEGELRWKFAFLAR
jgi:hypothetical protein